MKSVRFLGCGHIVHGDPPGVISNQGKCVNCRDNKQIEDVNRPSGDQSTDRWKRKQLVLELIKRNKGINIKRVLAAVGEKTQLSHQTIYTYITELELEGKITFDSGKIYPT